MTDPAETRTPRERTRGIRPHLKARVPELLALGGLAVTQPLLDLFGANPEFFVASGSSRSEIVAFALLIGFGVPLLLALLESLVLLAAGPVAADRVHTGLLGLLAGLLGLAVAADVGVTATLGAVAVAALLALGVLLARRRWAGFRLALRYLGFAPFLFVGLFLLGSATGELLRQGEASVAEGVRVGSDAPVVMVMFDELPLSSLLRSDGTINEQRFPAFARLAETGTWYRNATSVSAGTTGSVPSTLAGRFPEDGQIPTSSDYPENLFTLLGAHYRMDVSETLTDLCPSSACAPERTGGLGAFVDHLRDAAADATVVYGHVVLPSSWREDLPAVDQSWEGFLDEADTGGFDPSSVSSLSSDESARSEFFDQMREQNRDAFAGLKGDALLRAVESARFTPASLFFAHESFPHFLWERTPEGGVYDGDGGPPGVTDGRWREDPYLVRQGFQRHLLQVGYADTVLGQLINRLEATGVWDDALVVITADHGIGFRPGSPTRQPTERNVQEIYRVPLLVKAPGQVEGGPDDRNALLVDVLPTIVDLLDVEVDWSFDGISLVGPEREDDDKPVVYSGPGEVPGGYEEAVDLAQRNTLLLPVDGGWPSVARVGPDVELFGRRLRSLRVVGAAALTWSVEEADVLADYRPGLDPIPLVLHGEASSPLERLPRNALLVVNGRVAGALELRGEDTDDLAFTALIDHSRLRPGENSVQLVVPDRDERLPSWRVAAPT